MRVSTCARARARLCARAFAPSLPCVRACVGARVAALEPQPERLLERRFELLLAHVQHEQRVGLRARRPFIGRAQTRPAAPYSVPSTPCTLPRSLPQCQTCTPGAAHSMRVPNDAVALPEVKPPVESATPATAAKPAPVLGPRALPDGFGVYLIKGSAGLGL